MSVTSTADVLHLVEKALAGLDAEAGWQPGDGLAGVLIRRRHSLRLLRRALGPVPQPSPAQSPADRQVPGDLVGLIRTEERLADVLDAWLASLSPHDPRRAMIEHLRCETDDAARVLRLMQAASN